MFILYGFVIAAVIMDLRSGKISNRLILIGIGVALIRRLLQEGGVGLLTGALQISFPVIILYLFFLLGALGAGDIKLFSLVGGFVNFRELVACIIVAFILGAIWSFVKLLLKGPGSTIHFSVVILAGLFIATIV